MRRISLLILGILAAGSAAWADPAPASSVVSPFQLEMSRADLYALLARSIPPGILQGRLSIPMPDLTVTSPFLVTVSGIRLNLDYQLALPSMDPDTLELGIRTERLSASLSIQRIDATKPVQEQIGNILATINVNGYCSDVQMALDDSGAAATARGSLDFQGGRPRFQLTGFSARWTPGAWHVGSMTCHGPQGFDALVKQSAEQQLHDAGPLLAAMKAQIQQWIDQKLQSPLTIPIGTALVGPRSFEVASPGPRAASDLIRIQGSARFVFPGASSTCDAVIPSVSELPGDPGRDSLILPADAVPALMRCAQLNGTLRFGFDSTQVEGFRKFEHSRVKELLVWPNLVAYDEDTVFEFQAHLTAPANASDVRSEGPHRIAMNLDAPAAVDMSAPEGGKYVPYVHFSSPISGPAHLTIENGQATLRIDRGTAFSLDSQWDPGYSTSHLLMDRILLTPQIEDAVHTMLLTSGLRMPLPSAALAGGSRVSFSDADLQGGNLVLGVELSGPKSSN